MKAARFSLPAPAGRLGTALALVPLAAFYLYRNLWVAWRELAVRPGDFGHYFAATRSLAAGGTPYTVAGFDYPPLPAFLLLPLAGLEELAARQVWLCVGQVCLLAAAGLLWRLLGGGRGTLLVVAAVWCLAGTVAENLVLGQVSPLLLLLLVLCLWGLDRGRPAWSGAAVGAAAALKLWPAVLFGVHALAGQRRALAGGGVALLLLLVLPWGLVFTLPAPHLPQAAGYWMGTPALLSFSLPAVALRLADPPAGRGALPRNWLRGNDPRALELPPGRQALAVGVAALTLALGGLTLGRRWRGRRKEAPAAERQNLLLAATALVALALAASPIAWYHYQLLQLPGVALLASRWRRRAGALAGLALLAAGLTWTHALVGLYVGRFGWTAARPTLLWLLTSLVPALTLTLFALQLREIAGEME